MIAIKDETTLLASTWRIIDAAPWPIPQIVHKIDKNGSAAAKELSYQAVMQARDFMATPGERSVHILLEVGLYRTGWLFTVPRYLFARKTMSVEEREKFYDRVEASYFGLGLVVAGLSVSLLLDLFKWLKHD